MQQLERLVVSDCIHALVLVFARWDKHRKLDLPLLSPNRAKGWITKMCRSLKYQGTSEDPCPQNTTALLWAVARQDIALTGELALRQTHCNQKMQCFESKRPLWAKIHTQWQQTPHLHLMGSLPCIQRSNCKTEIHTLRNAWQNVAVSPNRKSELPNVTKWPKTESTATHDKGIPAYKIQHREEI